MPRANNRRTERLSGVLRFFVDAENYGFVRDDDGADYFVHYGSFADRNHMPQPDDRVFFTPVQSRRGTMAAVRVTLA
jgi:cold shock CspA family protein